MDERCSECKTTPVLGVVLCPLHGSARALLEALEEMVEEAPSAEVYDMRGPIGKAHTAIAQAKSVA